MKEKGLLIEEATITPDDEHCVSIPIQNFSHEPLHLEPGEILSQLQPVNLLTDPTPLVEQFVDSIAGSSVIVSECKDSEVVVVKIDGSTCEKMDGHHVLWEACLLKSVHLDENLSPEEVKQLSDLISEFSDIFAINQSELSFVTHVIDTGDNSPIKQHPRRIPLALRDKVDQLVKEMLDQGIVVPSKSPWASPVVLIAKTDGSTRFCVDYRRLNSVTKTDVFPFRGSMTLWINYLSRVILLRLI